MPIVTQAEFARLSNVGRSTVSGWITAGIISGDALIRRGSKVLVDTEKAARQVQLRRDAGQAMGNGLHVRTKTAPTPPPARLPVASPAPAPASAPPPESGRTLFATPSDPYARGALDGLLALAYRVPADAAFYAIEAGAPLPVAYALAKSLTEAVQIAAAELFAPLLPGDAYPLRYPAAWEPVKVESVPWENHARERGEPVDLDAWEAWAAERDALNNPPD